MDCGLEVFRIVLNRSVGSGMLAIAATGGFEFYPWARAFLVHVQMTFTDYTGS
jgi:hypothetical protein